MTKKVFTVEIIRENELRKITSEFEFIGEKNLERRIENVIEDLKQLAGDDAQNEKWTYRITGSCEEELELA